ncbi:uncharacterized protein FSUBG_13293 [Fusarium subglutinans]|uniref:Uncharacterized protein n=1 Tax=Gibberella subglutinans TaxID=42677 RepID=A0A8H5KWQ6_GIBSU|nr:uncharacterized protein FSUBG_13293 [Fusarium subglutinans]KAF5580828.1 hypothetical protein FSUBG_13293 [Fusarium subglutinans]
MAEHVEISPNSSPSRAPSLDKSQTASRKVSPTETPLPSPPDSLQRARTAAVALPQVLAEVLGELEVGPRDEDFYKTFPLSWEDFKSTREAIEATFRRFDYDPFKGKITIQMPSPVHDSFAGSFNTAIGEKFFHLKVGDTDTAKFVANIRSMLTTDILLNNQGQASNPGEEVDKKRKKSPDLQYRHLQSKHPGVVIEVAHSQQAKQLKKLAKDYIAGRKGGIKVVIGFDINKNKESTVSPFRDACQQPLNSDHKLVLTLHDLAAKKDLLANVEDLPIAIRYDELCGFVNEMEKLHKEIIQYAEESGSDSIEVRLSSSSSIEKLSTDDEHEEAQKKTTKNDTSFSRSVGKDIKDRPNVATRSASKRRAPTNTGENLPVPKRRRGRK